jgi:hypothetical protein
MGVTALAPPSLELGKADRRELAEVDKRKNPRVKTPKDQHMREVLKWISGLY